MAYYFKVLDSNRTGGFQKWKWPGIGVWTPKIKGKLKMCENGYHICRPREIFTWYRYHSINNIWLVETKYKVIKSNNKVATRQARLIRRLELSLPMINAAIKSAGLNEKIVYKSDFIIWFVVRPTGIQKKIMKHFFKVWKIKAKW